MARSCGMNRLSTEYSLLAVLRSPSVCQISWNVALDLGYRKVFVSLVPATRRCAPSQVAFWLPLMKRHFPVMWYLPSTGVASYGEPGGSQATILSGFAKISWVIFGWR